MIKKMIEIKDNLKKEFSITNINFFFSKLLKSQSKIILAGLMSIPDEYEVDWNDYISHFSWSKYSILLSKRECVEKGFLHFEKVKNSLGNDVYVPKVNAEKIVEL